MSRAPLQLVPAVLRSPWDRPSDEHALRGSMRPPKRFCWLVSLRAPLHGGLTALWDVSPIVGVLLAPDGRSALPVAVRPVADDNAAIAVLRDPMPPDFFARAIYLHDPPPETVAAEMLRAWKRGTLRSDRLVYSDLV